MSITKRPNGVWRARYRDETGREHFRHFARKVDARAWLDEVTGVAAERRFQAAASEERRAARFQPGAAASRPGTIYYARLGPLVKIGFSRNLPARMATLNLEEVLATERGFPYLERQRHREFAALHVHAEWFRYEAALIEHVTALLAAAAD